MQWAEDGELGRALKSSPGGAGCTFKPYPEMSHGWSCRGDLADDKVRRDVGLCMQDALGFLAQHLK